MRVLEATASNLAAVSKSVGEKRIAQPLAPGKWSPREILVHLADCELAFGFRYRQALGEDDHVVQPFDQDKWAKSYAAYDTALALSTFAALRNWNLTLIRTLSPEQLSKVVSHPERGRMTFRTLLETTAGHDIHHLRQLEAFARQAA
ncbi:MAG TPA: DinB family protein [Terriglobales bacterium]